MRKLSSIEFVGPGTPETEALEEKLAKEFTSFRVPASVVKKTGRKSLEDVAEPWLIVLCTPETPACAEVRERIEAFTREGNYHRILTLLVRGKPEESFPRELVFETLPDGTVREHEPLAANIAAESWRESLRLLSVEKLRLLAPIFGVSFDELRNRRLRNQIRLAAAIGSVVLIGAAAFFAYAFSRMTVISAQNKALQEEFSQAEQARDRAEEQRDMAMEEFAGTTAIRAREALEKHDSELAMLLCLEFLPETGLTTDLPDILSEALHGICAEGYVPVTTVREYGKYRYRPEPEEEPAEEQGAFPEKISRPVPEEYDNGKDTFAMNLQVSSEEYGYAVYHGSFDFSRSSADDVYRNRVCFPDEPDRDYDMPYRTEPYKGSITAEQVLYDGTFIGRESISVLFRYNPFTREFLPFYDDPEDGADTAPEEEILPGDPEACRAAGIYAGEIPGKPAQFREEYYSPYALSSDLEDITAVPGVDGLIFGYTRTSTSDYGLENDDVKTYVFSEEPFRYLYTIEDVISLYHPENCGYVLGMTGKKILVFSAEPFRYLYTLEDELTTPLAGFNLEVPGFPDGRNWLYVHQTGGKGVYDLDAAKRLCAITDPGQDYSCEISSDGLILSSVRKTPTLWRPEDGSVFREIRGVEEEEPELFGEIDEQTGRRSASAVRVGSIVYEYRESAIPVPEDVAEQASLARQLLDVRKLTKKERKTYDLELPGEQEEP